MVENGYKSFTVKRLPEGLHRRLKALAAIRGVNIEEMISAVIERGLGQVERENQREIVSKGERGE